MQVLTPFVADPAITLMGSEHEGGDRGIHERDVHLLRQSNVVVAEVSRELLIIDCFTRSVEKQPATTDVSR